MSGPEFYVPALNGTAFMGMARCAPPDTPKWGPHDSRWVTEATYDAALARVKDLEGALRGLYEDQVDYLTLNNLGGMDNHWMKAARAALSGARSGEET